MGQILLALAESLFTAKERITIWEIKIQIESAIQGGAIQGRLMSLH
jgi:hypothetical protein